MMTRIIIAIFLLAVEPTYVHGISCSWGQITSLDSNVAIGSMASFAVNITSPTSLPNGAIISWNYDGNPASSWIYLSGSFTQSVAFSRGSSSISLDGSTLTLVLIFNSLVEDDNGKILRASNDACTPFTSSDSTVTAEYCGTEESVDDCINLLDRTNSSFGEMTNATCSCSPEGTLSLKCEGNAKWSVQTGSCISATTEPSSTASTTTPISTATTKSTSPSSTTEVPVNTNICIGMCFFDYGRNETTCLNQYYNKHSSPAQVINGTIMADIVLYCTGFTAGFIAGITITTVGGVILCSYIVAGFITVDKWTNKLLIPLIATAFWALGIGLSFGLEDGSYDMGGGQIAGCCIGCIATIALGVSCVFVLKSANKDDHGRPADGVLASPPNVTEYSFSGLDDQTAKTPSHAKEVEKSAAKSIELQKGKAT